MESKYPPYMTAYGKIAPIFDAIKKAAVPEKFNYNFLETILGFKSSSDRAIMALLKRLDFITPDGVPTELYRAFRHKDDGPIVLADSIKRAFSDIFLANEYAYKLSRNEIEEIIRIKTGAADKSITVTSVVGTFDELCKLANFETKSKNKKDQPSVGGATINPEPIKHPTENNPVLPDPPMPLPPKTLGLSYTINLNLPPTTDIEVFNAIFKSLKEHIFYDKR
jgi:hypothetical protein